ncbi:MULTISPECIES: hypothetical protein [Acinetobacter]|uniref:Uncharacterized protein n=1 Tax=Acinetobacter piscicola TaxID=2006115 RepID=A0A7S6VXS8_9GAMM|nr:MULTISPECIES: hypothetical protein [Acinetobacter]QOW46841.1 hypothetical protein G0028_13570 [Acinetobacter piscicola]
MKTNIVIFIVVISIFILSCSKIKKTKILGEGDIVTWKVAEGSELIVQAKLGTQLKYSDKDRESPFYRPKEEKYLGQFPINYQPPKLKKITISEASNLPIDKGNKLKFNLMLNGSTVQASGYDYTDKELDHSEQVRVIVSSQSLNFDLSEKTVNYFESIIKDPKNIRDNEYSGKYKLDCYRNIEINQRYCFGKSSNKNISGVLFRFTDRHEVIAHSWEPFYGAIDIEWQFDQHNMHQWKEIDRNIWRLLEAWNISPKELNDNTKYQDKYKKGDMITWQVSPKLLIKTQAGACLVTDYKYPSKKYFLGQFPIYYVPKKQKLLNIDRVSNIADSENPMEFNLLLNGQKDAQIHGFYNKNVENQVKVLVRNLSNLDQDSHYIKNKRTPRDWINYLLSSGYSKNEKLSEMYDLECYTPNYPEYLLPADQCIGRSVSPEDNEFILKIYEDLDHKIIVSSTIETKKYGHIAIDWRVPVESLKDWKEIDANIWRLLKAWNVKAGLI